ncbi:hypothetical protein ZIOFF_063490 [Zingiber officinale]|uniref:Uncharacterized protein n=1 Tax=Zingiber officinale TaxID=94328 RepID=A0A8J5KK62_ZINOF|nr:hypothetical protein ZIOFF_063490 [Zingiber officinale]
MLAAYLGGYDRSPGCVTGRRRRLKAGRQRRDESDSDRRHSGSDEHFGRIGNHGSKKRGREIYRERIGDIPKSVDCFSYDDASCLLEVQLYGPYYAHYEDKLTYFDSKEQENLSYGTLRKRDPASPSTCRQNAAQKWKKRLQE